MFPDQQSSIIVSRENLIRASYFYKDKRFDKDIDIAQFPRIGIDSVPTRKGGNITDIAVNQHNLCVTINLMDD